MMIKNTILLMFAVYLMFSIGDPEANELNVYYKDTLPYLSTVNDIPDGKSSTILRKYAIDKHIKLNYIPTTSISQLISNVESDVNSVGIGAITINHDRLLHINYSLPYHITSTVIAYKNTLSYKSILSQFLTILYAFKPFFFAMIIVSALLTIAKMKMFDSLYLSIVVATTVGFGDIIPKGLFQKLIIIIWMLISTYFLALFTSVLTVSLNNNIDHKPILVGVISSSEGSRVCSNRQYDCKSYDNIDSLIKAFRSDQVDSIILDKEVIGYYELDVSYKNLGNNMHAIISNKNFDNKSLNNYIIF